jgi:L-rhamnose mutarotase
MKIPQEHAVEYQRRHDEIWPELVEAIREAGISDYSIFYDEDTGFLFAYLTLSEDHQMDTLADKAIVQKWWRSNEDIQIYENGQPYMRELKEVFHMD